AAGTAGRHHSLMLLGPTGTGKTFEAYGALRRIAEAGIRNPFWLGGPVPQLLATLRPGGNGDFDKCANAPVLLLDDIGAERTSPWTEETALRLFNHRYENGLPILVTGNGGWEDILAYLGDRMASRLVEMCNLVEMRGRDRRWQR
ncbi:MAG TPA: ATP-binding protein, partial [Mycobacterium sp.]|nr:ATP-binding protein [Mycobacterium sp.]